MSCVAQIKILEIHQKEIFPGEISVTISGCESGFWCWTQSQVRTELCIGGTYFPCRIDGEQSTENKSTVKPKKFTEKSTDLRLKVSLSTAKVNKGIQIA